MDALQNFYSNLFSIEITALGIIAAAIFVFLQILHSNFSYRDMVLSLKQVSLVLYVWLSIIVILLTGFGSLHFALGTHDFIPFFDLRTALFFANHYAVAALLLGFLLSAGLGILTIFGSIKLLNPASLMRKHLAELTRLPVGRFLYRKYGVPTPTFLPISISYSLPDNSGKPASAAEQREEQKRREAKYAAEQANYERLKKEVEGAPDVFEGFESLLLKAVAAGDTATVRIAIADWVSRLKVILQDADSSFPTRHLATYVAESLRSVLGACKRHDTQSLSPEFVRATRTVASAFMKHHSHDVREIQKGWKEQADAAIADSDRFLFREIIQSYKEIADIAFEREKHTPQESNDILDESFRNMGWLAERLLTKRGVVPKPIMHDTDYYDEFDALYDALFHFEYQYNNQAPEAYPLIFFDAVHVLFDRLLEIYKSPTYKQRQTMGSYDLKNRLFDCAYVYASFGEHALRVGNTNGVELAALNLKQAYKAALEAEAEEIVRDSIELIVRLAIHAAANPDKLTGDKLLGKPIPVYLEEEILSCPYQDAVSSEVFSSALRIDDNDHDKKWTYIKSLGKKMSTNFGFTFDPTEE